MPYPLKPREKLSDHMAVIQDRLVRTCARENISEMKQAQSILDDEVHRYNYRQVHSATKEVPYYRFQRALQEKKSLLREFQIKPPFQSIKDIFCLRMQRTTDAYRKISINNLVLKVKVMPQQSCS